MERSRAGSQVEHDLDGLGLSGAGGGVEAVGDAALAEAEAVRDHGQHVHALVLKQAQAQRVLREHSGSKQSAARHWIVTPCKVLFADCARQTPMTANKSRTVR